MKRSTKRKPGAFGALGADAYFLLLDAIQRANSTDGTKIRDALAETKNFQAISGTINMGDNGNAVKSMVINKVEGGKFVYVTTVNP